MADRQQAVRVNLNNFYKKMDAAEASMTIASAEAVDELGQIGADEMRKVIRESESSFSSTKLQYGLGPAGRIRTGAMLRSVASRLRRGTSQIIVEVGYLRNYQDYFGYQDQGFLNVWKIVGYNPNLGYPTAPNAPNGFLFEKYSGSKTEGIFALREARQRMLDEAPRVMRKAEGRITRRINRGAKA